MTKNKKSFHCNSKNVVYWIECRVLVEQYLRSTFTKFWSWSTNYKSTHHNFRKKNTVPKQALKQKDFMNTFLPKTTLVLKTGSIILLIMLRFKRLLVKKSYSRCANQKHTNLMVLNEVYAAYEGSFHFIFPLSSFFFSSTV